MDATCPKARRKALLSSLYFAAGTLLSARTLRQELQDVHFAAAPVALDQVRADLTWLRTVGMVRYADDHAVLTEAGRDVVTGAAPWPGD